MVSISQLPNLITISRIALAPVLILLLKDQEYAASLAVFVIAGVSDGLDGFIAKRFHFESRLGSILDPLADKLLVASVLIMLAALDRPGEPSVPAWLVVLILARESAVTVIRGIALTEGVVMQAETLGKHKLILQVFGVIGLLVHFTYGGIDFYAVGLYFLGLSAVIAVWSGVNYHVQFFRRWQLRGSPG